MNQLLTQSAVQHHYHQLYQNNQQYLQDQSFFTILTSNQLTYNSYLPVKIQNISDGAFEIFPLLLVPIAIINLVMGKICAVLPSNVLPLIWIIHITDIIVSVTIVVLSSDLTQTDKKHQIKIGNQHIIILVGIFKYINIINNNIFRINSHSNIIHDNFLLQLVISTLYYTSYCYGTGYCDISKGKYTGIVCSGIVVSAIYFYLYKNIIQKNDSGLTHDHVQLIGVFCYCVLVPIYKQIAAFFSSKNMTVQSKSSFLQNSISNSLNKINTSQSKLTFHHLLFLLFTIGYILILTTPHCYNNWQYMLIMVIGVCFGSGHHHSLAFINTRYMHIIISALTIYITMYLTTCLFTGSSSSESQGLFNSCRDVIQCYNFHISLILALSISYLYLTLQQYTMAPSQITYQNSTNQKICKFFLIISPQNISNSTKNQKQKYFCSSQGNITTNDKYYTSNLQISKLFILILTAVQCIISYTMYSYLSYNTDSLYIINGTGSVFIIMLFICTYILIQKYELYTVSETPNSDKNNRRKGLEDDEDSDYEKQNKYMLSYSYRYAQKMKKVIIAINAFIVLKHIYTIGKSYQSIDINENASLLNYFSNNLVTNLLFPKCYQLYFFYHLYYNVHSCYSISFFSTFSSNSVINTLQSMSMLAITSLTALTFILPSSQMLNSPKFRLYYLLYMTTYAITATLVYLCILYGICEWQCLYIQHWTQTYIQIVLIWIYFQDIKIIMRYNMMKQQQKNKQTSYLQLRKKYRKFLHR